MLIRLLAGAMLFCVVAWVNGADTSSILKAGTRAPTFSLPGLDGKRIALSVYCGDKLSKPHINDVKHIVVLSFWATYCKPCRKEIPELMKLAGKLSGKPVKIFCISIDKEGGSKVGPFVAEKKYSLPILLDPYSKTAERYGVTSLPSLFVIDKQGVVKYSSVGYDGKQPLDTKLEAIIRDVEAGKALSTASSEEGEREAVEAPGVDESAPSRITPRQRWKAVARVEYGDDPQEVADELDVPVEALKTWYSQLKDAALNLWQEVVPVPGELEE
ncbi:MAG: redoxin domain-containing protein [Chitinivibrionales bacterium]|nr:redoxin domain-containing protein [Chitinivibrionales bacterium]